MIEKRFTLREPKVDNDISCSEIADNGEWISYGEIVELLNNLSDENEQLKQRNINQYKQLNQLWQLIEAKDWKTLTAMDNQMKEDEERLQKEWRYYE